ncbi:hypothetical protein [Kineococcus sp. SYSU DK005]|uniref:hypothetical protein n=1 Tax=Kineococcus sp. SYSU DK005 TaxID=3383126 RepID=UPI003D7F0D22
MEQHQQLIVTSIVEDVEVLLSARRVRLTLTAQTTPVDQRAPTGEAGPAAAAVPAT